LSLQEIRKVSTLVIYVRLNGHIIGSCTLMPYSDSEDSRKSDQDLDQVFASLCSLFRSHARVSFFSRNLQSTDVILSHLVSVIYF
jgi:hypothetical protein